jgi:hypothetical protein
MSVSDPTLRSPRASVGRWRRLLIVIAVLAGLYIARAPLLRGLAGLLISEEPGATAYLVLLGGDRRHEQAAEWYREGGDRRILVIESCPERLQALGLAPTPTEVDRLALGKQGVPESALIVLPAGAGDDWQRVRALGEWLQMHPGSDVTLLCDRFGSRRLHLICGRILAADAARVHLCAVRHRVYDESDWWQHKEGQLTFLDQGLRLTYTWLAGERTAPYTDWDPDAYEAGLR